MTLRFEVCPGSARKQPKARGHGPFPRTWKRTIRGAAIDNLALEGADMRGHERGQDSVAADMGPADVRGQGADIANSSENLVLTVPAWLQKTGQETDDPSLQLGVTPAPHYPPSPAPPPPPPLGFRCQGLGFRV